MNENIKKYPKEKNKKQINIVEKRRNHIVLESKYEKPSSKKISEQKFENTQEISSGNKVGNLPIISGKNNLAKSNVYDNIIANEKQKEKDIKQNKENIKRRNQNSKTEKEQQEGIKFRQEIDKSTPKEKNISYSHIKEENINTNNTYNYNSYNILNIKSIFIVKKIFSYIYDENFEYKLFKYSNLLKQKFKIDLKDYIKKYSEQLHYEKLVDEPLIPSSSPLFGKLVSNDTIYIFQDNLEKDTFRAKYCKILNDPNLNYSSIYYIFNNKNFYDNFLDNLEELNIDFNKIKTITLNAEKYIQDKINFNDPNVDFNKMKAMVLHPEYFITDNYNYFLKSIFSLNNIKNNLVCLKIYFCHKHCAIYPDSFDEINDMKVLKYLYIININFAKNIEIKLNNLKTLYCNKCKNANSIYINCKNLKKLYYNYNGISDLNNLKVKFEKLETLDLSNNNISNIDISKYANSKELKVLNLSNNKISDLNFLKNVDFKELKELNLGTNNISDISVLENVNFEKLQKLDLNNNKISNIDISKFKFGKYLNF